MFRTMLCLLLMLAICLAACGPALAADTSAEDGDGCPLTLRERRQLGLGFFQLLKTAKELDQAGRLDRENPDVAVGQLLAVAQEENPKAWRKLKASNDRDWDEFFNSLIAFLEKLIPLLIILIDLFSRVAPVSGMMIALSLVFGRWKRAV